MPEHQPLPQSSPMRCFAAGALVPREAAPPPAPAWDMAPVEMEHRPAPEPEEPVRLDVTRAWINGVAQELPRAPLDTAPPPVPQESPVRTFIHGQRVDPATVPVPPEPEVDAGRAQLDAERDAREVWLARAMSREYLSAQEWRELQASENRYGARLAHRARKRRLFIADEEQVPQRRGPEGNT